MMPTLAELAAVLLMLIFLTKKRGQDMNIGDKVKIKEWAVDEGVVGEYFGKIGTVKAKYERNVTVVYEDGQKLFFFANELEVIK